MERNVDLNEITDGKLYGQDDLAKVGCNDCKGCHQCCTGMGDSIVLDPYDIYELSVATGKSCAELLSTHIELGVMDGLIVPHIKMDEESGGCLFLDENGRCTIHAHRPGICRLFPLGRLYREDGGFDYINQIHECPYPNKTKVRIRNWLGIDGLAKYEDYIKKWHMAISNLKAFIIEKDDVTVKAITMNLLNLFYLMPYDMEKDFYEQFNARYDKLLG